MKGALALAFLLLLPRTLEAEDYRNLPVWAHAVYEASRKAPRPEGADAWVLLNRTEFAYTGKGEIAIHRCQMTEVLTEQGTQAGTFETGGLCGRASKVKNVKGWNLCPNGKMMTVDRDNLLSLDLFFPTGDEVVNHFRNIRVVADDDKNWRG